MSFMSASYAGLGDMSLRTRPDGAPSQAPASEKSHHVIATTAGCEKSVR